MVEVFSVPAFFICFRETLEASIILSVMLSLLNKVVPEARTRRELQKQVWGGVVLGVVLTLVAATVFLSLYYTVAKDAWDSSESLWEGILGMIAVVLITLMGISMIRVDTWRAKWEKKLTKVTLENVVGWRDEATIGTLTSYIAYWVFIGVTLLFLRIKWKRDAERDAEAAKLEEADKEGRSGNAIEQGNIGN